MCKMSIEDNNIHFATDAQSEPPRSKLYPTAPQKINNESGVTNLVQNSDNDDAPVRPARKKQSNNKLMNIEQNIGENDNVNASGVNNVINIVNSKHVHIGGLVNINVNEGDEKYKKRKNKKYRKSNIATSIQEDETVKALMSSDEKCTRVHMEIIKKHIGKNWRNVFRKLDYSNGEIEQLYIDYINEGISEVIHQGLVDWTQNNPDEATLGKICTVLWEENCCDVIERLIN